MLCIKGRENIWKEWHVGDGPLPEVEGPVITIQADGHELTWLNEAIEIGKNIATKNYYKVVHRTIWNPEDGSYGY